MKAILANLGQILLMIALLAGSGFMSGSETAFFNLTRRQVQAFRQSSHRLHLAAAHLLGRPRILLTSLLFANMTVNVLYFAISSVLSMNLAKLIHPAMAGVTGIGAFVLLLLFGEMLPKSIAYSHSRQFALAAAPGVYLCTRITAPLLAIFDFIIVSPAVRLLTGGKVGQPIRQVNPKQLKILIDSSFQKGAITPDQSQIFSSVVELGFLKVRHVMRPRVDMVACDIRMPLADIKKTMTDNDLTVIPIYSRDIDNFIGVIYLKDLLLRPDEQPNRLLKRVPFVPEQKSIESLLEFFRESDIEVAVALDEFGGIAGIIDLQDIIEELLGTEETEGMEEPIQQLGPLKYRLSANLPVHEWSQSFGIDLEQSRFATVGGFVTALLRRVPKEGDTAKLGNIKFTVEKVKKHRIESIILELEPLAKE
ncbi:Magnesium and cobalt efflux protein CorC [Anaerohalosphaera lusitana]|uniref:Magnesium and cobalt efflux protein CorC n=1 Tax=Anaerohalosphaera lusitana TaxID=1936003 RepID=A0A1U9NN25_9BACT|nr:hemolysin family protein [Anaerohalosphaera lusitana]AQT69144.1 Magnesium and cobalt efflux protein CorC [Anaerohalosphaera lusitana]